MNEFTESPTPESTPEAPKNNRRTWIIVVVAVLVICFCCILPLALYYGYDYLGDPLGIYGALPRMIATLVA